MRPPLHGWPRWREQGREQLGAMLAVAGGHPGCPRAGAWYGRQHDWHPHPAPRAQVEDVVGTFRMLAQLPSDSMGAYIISMSHTASDVLAVVLLQKECGGERSLLACGLPPAASAPFVLLHFMTSIGARAGQPRAPPPPQPPRPACSPVPSCCPRPQ